MTEQADQQQLIDRATDAIVFHPGNRGGDYELRRDVAQEIARTVVKALLPELDELAKLRAADRQPQALAVSWSEWDETVPPRDRIMQDMRELTEVADPDHRARRHARTSINLDAYRAQVIGEIEALVRDRASGLQGTVAQATTEAIANLIADMADAPGSA